MQSHLYNIIQFVPSAHDILAASYLGGLLRGEVEHVRALLHAAHLHGHHGGRLHQLGQHVVERESAGDRRN